MQRLAFVTLLALLAAVTAQNSTVGNVTAPLNCTGVTGPEFDDWCFASCNNDPPECPSSICICEGDEVVSPPTPLACSAVGFFSQLPHADSWCELNCNYDPPFCPSGFCACVNNSVPAVPTAPMQPHVPTCCNNENRFLFYSDAGHIYKRSTFDDVDAASELCYELPGGNPTSLIVDDADNLWVADPILGVVLRMSTDCDANSVEVIQSWARDQFIDKPTALAILPGEGLIVSGSTNTFFITFTMSGDVNSVDLIDFNGALVDSQFFVRDIEVVNGVAFMISRDARVIAMVPDVGQHVVLDFHEWNIVDYGGITINDCGLYFTDSDSNQIWFCPEMNTTLCHVYCAQDENLGNPTCVNTNNPTAISSGCCCDIYVANPGNGCVTKITNATENAAPHVPEIVACNLTHPNAFTFWVPPGSPANCVQECDPDEPTASPSPSPSPSVAPRVTGRLVPGVNLQFAGGVTRAAVLTGIASVVLVKCPPGVDLTGLTDPEKAAACPALPSSSFRVPISQLKVVDAADNVTNFPPFLTASSADSGEEVCMLHTSVLINRGGNIDVCDNACLASGEGVATSFLCAGTNINTDDTQKRTREAATEALRGLLGAANPEVTETELPNTAFQSASNQLCDGGSVVEFSVNLMSVPAGEPVSLNVLAQPRVDFADRCNDSPGEVAPRLCYFTSEFPANVAVHGAFGDENDFVCVDEFLLTGTETNINEFDEDLRVLQGDIVDTSFGVSGRAQGCPLNMQGADFNPLCYSQGAGNSIAHRICLKDNCPP